jgi:hypothetical protein
MPPQHRALLHRMTDTITGAADAIITSAMHLPRNIGLKLSIRKEIKKESRWLSFFISDMKFEI